MCLTDICNTKIIKYLTTKTLLSASFKCCSFKFWIASSIFLLIQGQVLPRFIFDPKRRKQQVKSLREIRVYEPILAFFQLFIKEMMIRFSIEHVFFIKLRSIDRDHRSFIFLFSRKTPRRLD